MQNIFIDFLPPWVETGLQPAFYDKESGTVLQQVARMYAKVNQLVKAFDDFSEDVATVVNDYIERFTILKDYVDNYFNNLDVQEEINNKLDDMVEDGTMATLIENYLSEYVEYLAQGFIPNERSMDCNIIRWHKQSEVKNIMVDCGTYEAWYYISQMLITEGISHLDYFILTHYHTDHDGNIENLITNGYIDENTVILVGCEYTNFDAGYNARMITDLGYFTNAGLTYRTPDEGEVITIDNLTLTFHNCTEAVIDAYGSSNSNNGSLVFLAEFNNTKALYAGDALDPVYSYLDSINFPSSNVDLFKIGHHGIQQYTDEKYIKRLSPVHAIQTSGITDFQKNNFGICEEVSLMKGLGTKIYASHMQPSYIRLFATQNNVTCIDGVPIGFSDQLIEHTFYVDANAGANAIQDGSQDHPFKEVMQAISAIEKTDGQNIIINVSAGDYGSAHESENNKNRIFINTGLSNRVEINGSNNNDTYLSGILIRNANVYLKNINIDTDKLFGTNSAIAVSNGCLSVENVSIDSKTSTATTNTAIALSNHSNMDVRSNLSINNVGDGISVQSGSIFTASGTITIGTITGNAIVKSTSALTYFNDYMTFTDSAIGNAFARYGYNSYSPIDITGTHTSYASSITLKQSTANFTWIEIFYRSNDQKYGSTGRIYNPSGKSVTVIAPNSKADGTQIWNKQCEMAISGDTISISRSLQMTINGSTASITKDTNNEYWDIVKVVGGFKDYAG